MSASKPLTSLQHGTSGVIGARTGKAIVLQKSQSLKLINTHGKQVIDFFAFALDSDFRPLSSTTLDFLSMQHTRSGNMRSVPKAGDKLYSNRRRPMLTFEKDTSPGVHDTLVPACDAERFRQLGVPGHHGSCGENLHTALQEAEYPFPMDLTPEPFNLWMNVPVREGGALDFVEPVSQEGDYVVLQAEENCLVVCSACPQDVTPVNGCESSTVFPWSPTNEALTIETALEDLSSWATEASGGIGFTDWSPLALFPSECSKHCTRKQQDHGGGMHLLVFAGDIPSFKLFENDRLLAFLDIQPLSLGHAKTTDSACGTKQLVVPKHHGGKLTDIPDESLSEILPVAKKLAQAMQAENYNILQNNGRLAHQEVDHIPKPNQTEGLGIEWPAQKTDMDKLKALFNDVKAKM
ncbi:MAG: hypothetical protein Q9173_001784 [Seirophora scorigena]